MSTTCRQSYRVEITGMNDPDEPLVKAIRFVRALAELAREKDAWHKNLMIFSRWDGTRKLKYMAYIEKQAQHGLPMAEELIAKVVELRLTE